MRDFKFCENWKKTFILPIVLFVVGIVLFFTVGLNIGVDFSGGSMIYVEIGEGKFNVEDVTNIVNKHSTGAIISYSGDNREGVDIRLGNSSNSTEVQEAIIAELQEKYEISANKFDVEYVGPTIGQGLIKNAILALIIAFVLMLAYIWIRFELTQGFTALIALLHDVLIMFVFVLIFRIQINTPFIAALLTIVGYSINNTIIVFDRIRSNRAKFLDKYSTQELVNISIKETLKRSINTTLTTLIVLVVLMFVNITSIRTFVFPIIIGVVAGFYSSVFIAGPLWVLMTKNKTVSTTAVKM